ncbi:MAG: hypothetical protein U0744_16925 [Gemmataceae bacterium]
MKLVHGKERVPKAPIVDLCEDRVVLPIAGVTERVPEAKSPIEPAWQRWNDCGIGCFLEGGSDGKSGGELGQAERSFQRLLSPEFAGAKAAHAHGHVNLARVHLAYGGTERIELARKHLAAARTSDPPAPWWTVAWFNGLVNLQNADFDEAIRQFETILDPANIDPVRKFDFTGDFIVRNELAKTLFTKAQQESDEAAQNRLLQLAASHFEKTLALDPENVDAHEFLAKTYHRLGKDFSGAAETSPDAVAKEHVLQCVEENPIPEAADRVRKIAKATTLAMNNPDDFRKWIDLRRALTRIADRSPDGWRRLAIQPALRSIDTRLLEGLPELAKSFAMEANVEERQRSAQLLGSAVASLNERPRRTDVRPAFLATWPLAEPGAHAMLLPLAELDVLNGGMSPTRLLTLRKVQQIVRSASKEADPASAHVLARIHGSLHGIFKPDENAQEHAVRVHRSRFPAADRASHPIVLYRLNEPFTQ